MTFWRLWWVALVATLVIEPPALPIWCLMVIALMRFIWEGHQQEEQPEDREPREFRKGEGFRVMDGDGEIVPNLAVTFEEQGQLQGQIKRDYRPRTDAEPSPSALEVQCSFCRSRAGVPCQAVSRCADGPDLAIDGAWAHPHRHALAATLRDPGVGETPGAPPTRLKDAAKLAEVEETRAADLGLEELALRVDCPYWRCARSAGSSCRSEDGEPLEWPHDSRLLEGLRRDASMGGEGCGSSTGEA